MNQKNLVKLSQIIEELESDGFIKESNELHEHFIKLSESLENTLPNSSAENILKKDMKLPKVKLTNFKFNILSSLADMGIDEAEKFIEQSKGPKVIFEKYYVDVIKLIDNILKLNNNPKIDNQLFELKSFIKSLNDEMKNLDSFVKTSSQNNNLKTFNNSKMKLAIRGDFESELSSYFRELVEGAAVGGFLGSILPGFGTLAGAISGSTYNVASKLIDDLWYYSISDTGKAYFQAKELENKLNRIIVSLRSISPEAADKISSFIKNILQDLEDENLKNPNATEIEKKIRSLENKIQDKTTELSNKATETLKKENFDESFPFVSPELDSRSKEVPAPFREKYYII